MPNRKRRYAVVGLGSRSRMYTKALAGTYAADGEIVALCDPNRGRMALANRRLVEQGAGPAPTYAPEAFDRLVAETRPDAVVVTSVDVTHSDYICRAMELGCDAITEKPMTIDAPRCRRILRTARRTGRTVHVTFNYRYAPPRSQVKALLAGGEIGEVLSVDFAWRLDTRHGADYFRRWHAERKNSGSLLVHKATHHFDLVNWWIDDAPQEVFAHGTRRYYTPARAAALGLGDRAERCLDCPAAARCPFHLDLAASEGLRALYLDHEGEDGYVRDRCVFSDRIDIWDSMSVAVRYRRGCLLNYMLHAYSPSEGYVVAFNGERGRLEHVCRESSYVSGDDPVAGALAAEGVATTLIPEFAAPRAIDVATGAGGHGGGDPKLLDDLFAPRPAADPLGRRASHRDGARSILIGIAAGRSIDTGRPVTVDELVGEDGPV
jgi:predicted dehydrogenase